MNTAFLADTDLVGTYSATLLQQHSCKIDSVKEGEHKQHRLIRKKFFKSIMYRYGSVFFLLAKSAATAAEGAPKQLYVGVKHFKAI